MTRRTAREARERIAEVLDEVEKTGEPVSFERDGVDVAVVISPEDFALLQRLREAEEDRLDVEAAREAMKEPGAVPWEQVKTDLGL